MDLIYRGYLLLDDQKEDTNKGKKNKKSVNLKINHQKNMNNLKAFEKYVLDFFGSSELYGFINLVQLQDNLQDQMMASSFRGYYYAWQMDLKNEYLSKDAVSELFIATGSKYFATFGIIGLIVGLISYFVLFFFSEPMTAAFYALISSFVLIISSIIAFSLPDRIGGRWTPYGADYNAKWKAFKKYLKDFSLMKEYPPESVEIWDKYLVYATALGIAKQVKKSMEKILPDEQLQQSNTYVFYHTGGYSALSSVISASMFSGTSGGGSSGGGGGGAGGGSGGGGGGAF